MDRREFSKYLGASVLATGAVGMARATEPPKAKSPAATSKSEKKQWAQAHLRGMENQLMASFTPDFKSLDEEGIRHDVRQSIKHGFCSCFVQSTGTGEHRKRLMEIARDEAKGKILTSFANPSASVEASIELLRYAEKLGYSHVLLYFPKDLNPQTEDEAYAQFRKLIDATSLAIVLYAYDDPVLRRFHPSGIPVNVFSRLADHPNVVGVKLTQTMNAELTFELCERLSNRLLVGPVNLDSAPILTKNYPNIQYSPMWVTESVQSPEKPYGVEFMDLIRKRRINEALMVYWEMQPLIQLIWDIQTPPLAKGGHPWAHMKYYQWAVGGNGGLLPLKASEAVPLIDAKDRQRIRSTYEKCGITPVDHPEEEFVVGRAAYAKGVRLADLTSTPLYA
jgi:4-hydroxy-tetrahydrodipicolinate synthase